MASAAEQLAANLSWGALGKATDLRKRIGDSGGSVEIVTLQGDKLNVELCQQLIRQALERKQFTLDTHLVHPILFQLLSSV